MAMTDKQAQAKDWLNRNQYKHDEIRALYLKLEEMRSGSVKAVSVPDADKVQTQPDPKRGENFILSIVAFEEMIKQKERQMHLSDLETARAIDKLPEARERTVLILRYLSYLPWERIARRLSYSEKTCQRIHEDALEHIADLINYTVT